MASGRWPTSITANTDWCRVMDVGFAALLIWQIGLYFAFDLLLLNGDDLRELPLVERKARLKTLIRKHRLRMLYVDHIEQRGCEFFDKACELDLEGVVAKRKDSRYRVTEKRSPHWIKIKNRNYSQAEVREELFERA